MRKFILMLLFAVAFVSGMGFREYQHFMGEAVVSAAGSAEGTFDETGKPVVDPAHWNLILVNGNHPLERELAIKLDKIGLISVDARIADSLRLMISDAKKEGINLQVVSGFRTLQNSAALLQDEIGVWMSYGYPYQEARDIASSWVAPPGTSEHHTGLAVDILSVNYYQRHGGRFVEAFENDPEGIWLRENCARYGFVLRYPKGKTDITGIEYEPWHFRYVGSIHAQYMMEHDLALEEYLLAD